MKMYTITTLKPERKWEGRLITDAGCGGVKKDADFNDFAPDYNDDFCLFETDDLEEAKQKLEELKKEVKVEENCYPRWTTTICHYVLNEYLCDSEENFKEGDFEDCNEIDRTFIKFAIKRKGEQVSEWASYKKTIEDMETIKLENEEKDEMAEIYDEDYTITEKVFLKSELK